MSPPPCPGPVRIRFLSRMFTSELLSVAAQLHRLKVELHLPSQFSQSDPCNPEPCKCPTEFSQESGSGHHGSLMRPFPGT